MSTCSFNLNKLELIVYLSKELSENKITDYRIIQKYIYIFLMFRIFLQIAETKMTCFQEQYATTKSLLWRMLNFVTTGDIQSMKYVLWSIWQSNISQTLLLITFISTDMPCHMKHYLLMYNWRDLHSVYISYYILMLIN